MISGVRPETQKDIFYIGSENERVQRIQMYS